MPPILGITHLKCTSREAQQRIVESLQHIAAYAQPSEPGVTKYAITIPRQDQPGQDTDILTIEEYIDEVALQAHTRSAAVQELLDLVQSSPSLLAGTPEVYQSRLSVAYTRPEAKNVREPVIVSAHFGYQPGKSTPALQGWGRLVAYAEQNEAGTLSYAVADDAGESFIRTAEVYESQEAIRSHLEGPMVAENQVQNGHWRTGERLVYRCTLDSGYFIK